MPGPSSWRGTTSSSSIPRSCTCPRCSTTSGSCRRTTSAAASRSTARSPRSASCARPAQPEARARAVYDVIALHNDETLPPDAASEVVLLWDSTGVDVTGDRFSRRSTGDHPGLARRVSPTRLQARVRRALRRPGFAQADQQGRGDGQHRHARGDRAGPVRQLASRDAQRGVASVGTNAGPWPGTIRSATSRIAPREACSCSASSGSSSSTRRLGVEPRVRAHDDPIGRAGDHREVLRGVPGRARQHGPMASGRGRRTRSPPSACRDRSPSDRGRRRSGSGRRGSCGRGGDG